MADLLTKEEERELAERIQKDDIEALDELVSKNMPLVKFIVSKFNHRFTNMDDAIQEGYVGLIIAAKRFNPDKAKFSTYAIIWIRSQMALFFKKNRRIVHWENNHIGRILGGSLRKWLRKVINFEDIPVKEIAEKLKITEENVKDMLVYLTRSDEKYVEDVDNEVALDSQPNPEEIYLEKELLSILKGIINDFSQALSSQEIYILENYVLADEPLTLRAIGSKYKISHQAVEQRKNRIEKRLLLYAKNILVAKGWL